MQVRHAALSDVGAKRMQNEDNWGAAPELGLFVVADGMGGHAGGETASRIAVDAVLASVKASHAQRPAPFDAPGELETSPLADVMREALEAACSAVHREAKATPDLDGMGTTTVALLCHAGYGIAAHVGDSRLYILREGRIQQLTEDHSLVGEQVKAGILTEEQARTSRFKNIITRSIGFEEEVLVDVLGIRLAAGDRLALCSDGLSNMMEDAELGALLGQGTPEEAARRLVDFANERGGDDNITVVVIEVVAP
jgi:serine/threonine protein phosphatase PrpC